jgi:APA family basic amino acid/polyamine antiporter
VTAVYVATTAAFNYQVSPRQATSASAFAQQAGDAMLGAAGPAVLASIVVLSVIASIFALLIMAPRLYMAMSHDKLFPSALAFVNPLTQSPVRATMLLAVMATIFVFIGTFQQIVALFMCTTLAFVALAAAALIRIRRRNPDSSAFACPGYPVTPVVFVLFTVCVVILVAMSRPVQAGTGLAVVLLGLPVYRALAWRAVG